MRNVLLFFYYAVQRMVKRRERTEKYHFFYILACVFFCVRILQMILRFFNDSFWGSLALLVVYSELGIWS